MNTRIKICGITRLQDADAVLSAGADAIGLQFVRESPRRVDLQRAGEIADAARGAAVRVGVFVDPERVEVEAVLDAVGLDVLQFHGDESGAFCRSFGRPYMKVVRVRGPLPMAELQQEYADACCLLLDAYVPGIAGGTGARFDWDLWPDQAPWPLVLAGGLTTENVADAVRRLAPWGVDVCGGVEGPVKGLKDPGKIRQFVMEVHGAGS